MMNRLIGYDEMAEIFSGGGIGLSEEMYFKLERYAGLLCEWNEKINLTAITDPEEIAVKHFYDSIYPFTIAVPEQGAGVIDVGTGAGFPSIPLKIWRSDLRLTLLDSLNKRVNFLSTVSDELGLGAECVHGRAEEAGRFIRDGNPMREAFDIATARAVANLRELCEYCLPFVKVGGRFIALKGRDGERELEESENAVKLLGGEVGTVRKYELPNGDGRTLIVIGKIKNCDSRYPRNSGQMKKKKL